MKKFLFTAALLIGFTVYGLANDKNKKSVESAEFASPAVAIFSPEDVDAGEVEMLRLVPFMKGPHIEIGSPEAVINNPDVERLRNRRVLVKFPPVVWGDASDCNGVTFREPTGAIKFPAFVWGEPNSPIF